MIQQDFLRFVAATILRGNYTTKFLAFRCRGLTRRQRELRREGFSSPPLSRAAMISQDFLGIIADTLPRGNDITRFLRFRCRGLARWQRNLRREGFSSPPLSRVATIQQDFLRLVAGAWRSGNENCAGKVFYCRLSRARQRYNKISYVLLPPHRISQTHPLCIKRESPQRFPLILCSEFLCFLFTRWSPSSAQRFRSFLLPPGRSGTGWSGSLPSGNPSTEGGRSGCL